MTVITAECLIIVNRQTVQVESLIKVFEKIQSFPPLLYVCFENELESLKIVHWYQVWLLFKIKYPSKNVGQKVGSFVEVFRKLPSFMEVFAIYFQVQTSG